MVRIVPPKEDVRSHTLKDGRVVKIHMQDNSTFVARHGNKRVGALIVNYPDKDGNRDVFNTEVHSDWRKLGIGTHLYDRAEEKFGKLVPSTAQTDDAVAFWQKRRPDAYPKDDLRFRADAGPSLIGKKVTHPEYGEGTITKALPNGASVTKDNGNTFHVGRKLLKDHGHIDESRLIPSFKQFLLETSEVHVVRVSNKKIATGTTKTGEPVDVYHLVSHYPPQPKIPNGLTSHEFHAHIGGDRVGWLILREPDRKYEVGNVRVNDEHRGKGVGSILYQAAEKHFGKFFKPSDNLLPDGVKFWRNRNAKFNAIRNSGIMNEAKFTPRTTEHKMKDGTPFKVVNTDSHTYFAMHNDGEYDEPVGKAQVAKDGNYIHDVDVSPDMQKRGIASEMYRRIEQDHGALQPSKSQSPRGFALWKSFRPSAIDPTDLRLKEKELVGKTVSHPDFGTGTIHGVGRYNAIVAKGLDTFTVPRKHLIDQGLLSEGFIERLTGRYKAVNVKHGTIDVQVKDNVYTAHKDGKEVAVLKIARNKNGDIFPAHTVVDAEHRRKGINTALYDIAEKHTGRKMIPSTVQTDAAKEFWKTREVEE